ncbi:MULTISPECIES: Spo0B C-terminal domain-containing protein [Cytobacillus]|uniref:Spo0B domain-containing protein n=1 Tax=Cytobacillus stercorigallinarum TaxID=2762240 RepID=A0ABR8QJJ6_9BACI|nr:Spo0B C-terminal domain-containing protein [Cytobacillus stercorigallinarum]MBD7935690.1 Spo0B domain-containing protein [Cytobacillus stercorigallinarum]
MEKDWDIVEVLRHARHDWLNKIQLIKGNLSLNKVERAKEIIDEIVVEAQQEAKLSNLQMPQFASLLFTYNWQNPKFQLEYDVYEVFKCDQLDDKSLTDWTRSFFSCLNDAVQPFADNHLSISINPEKQGVRFFFDFSGTIIYMQQIRLFLLEQSTSMGLTVRRLIEDEISFDFFVLFEEK